VENLLGGDIEDHPAVAEADDPIGEARDEVDLLEAAQNGDAILARQIVQGCQHRGGGGRPTG